MLPLAIRLDVLALAVSDAALRRPRGQALGQRGAHDGDAGAGIEEPLDLRLGHGTAAHHEAGAVPEVEGDGVVLSHFGCGVRRR